MVSALTEMCHVFQGRWVLLHNAHNCLHLLLTVGNNAVVSALTEMCLVFQGQWVLLHNAHNCPHLLNAVETLLVESLPTSSQSDQTFRLWVTTKAIPEVLPVRLIQNSVKIVINSPKVNLCSIS